ncbi:MAG: hypothetical protein U1E22_06810, partial [Coriobacteriia bacterium]|nr:hypothetical protein [Coriobacteriia bacterium]
AIVFGDRPDLVWFGGGEIKWERGLETVHRYIGKRVEELPVEAMEVDYITGAAMFARVETLKQVGYLPEEYFLYFEETDWCTKARQIGLRLIVLPGLRIKHYKRSETLGAPTLTYIENFCRSAIIYTKKYNPRKLPETLKVLAEKGETWIEQVGRARPGERDQARSVVETVLGTGGNTVVR